MQYMLLIYGDETGWEQATEEERRATYAEYGALVAELRERGQMLGGDELAATSTATTVRVKDGERLVTDGPFAETKEQLGGYFLVEAENLDEALAIASRIPSSGRLRAVEVRPVVQR